MYDGQKINQLRKSGQLDEALVLAREALAREPDNSWNKKAAGWVFYNLCKKALNDNDNQAALTYLTEFDALTIPADEEKIHTNFNRLRGQIKIQSETKPTNPHNLAKYYQQLADQFSDSGMSVGWEIYYGLKELGQTNQSVGQITLNILRVYAQLDIEKPSRLHSLILVQAVKLIDDDIKLLDFIKWWNVENLRSEDYERQTDNDHTYSSLAEKTATALAKGIKEKQSEEDASSILSFLEQLTSRYPDNIWMKYHYGKLLLLTGQITVARDWVIPVVRTQMNRAWIWNDLADFYPDDPDLELACLCRALQADQNDQFIGRIRLRLAVILANRKNYPAAKCEVVRVEQFYESKNWKFPAEFVNLLNTPWYATAEPTGDNTELYRAYAPQAEALVLAELPELNGVISRQQPDRDGKLGRVWISYRVNETMLSIPVKHKQFKWLKKAEVGTPVAIRVTDDTEQSRVLTLKKRQGDTWDIFEPFSGRFRARGTIGFVKDDASRREVFIPPYLVSEHKLADGQVISGRAEYSLDRKKQQMGWKAVIVSQVG